MYDSLSDPCAECPTATEHGVQDPAWEAALASANMANAALARGITQSPLEFRAVACAALRLAARPHDAGVDAAQAAAFAARVLC